MGAEAAIEGQTLSETPCHALREEPEEDSENIEVIWLEIWLAIFLRDNV